jgi:hypothetical protein
MGDVFHVYENGCVPMVGVIVIVPLFCPQFVGVIWVVPVGKGCTLTITVELLRHPPGAVAVTVYGVVDVGETEIVESAIPVFHI